MVESFPQVAGISGLEPQHRKVTLIEMDDGTWCWQTTTNGACMFTTAEQALANFLTVHKSLTEHGY